MGVAIRKIVHLLTLLGVLATGLAASPPTAPTATAYVQPLLSEALAEVPGGYVDALVTFWDRGDADLLRDVDPNAFVLELLPVGRAFLTLGEIEGLARRPEVRSIVANEVHEFQDVEVRRLTRLDELAGNGARGGTGGFTGAGVRIAVIDSGVDGTHPDLVDRIERNWRMVGTCLGLGLVQFTIEQETGGKSGIPDTAGCNAPAIGAVAVSTHRQTELWVDVVPGGAPALFAVPGTPMYNDTNGIYPSQAPQHGTPVAGLIAGAGAASDGLIRGAAPGVLLHSYGTNVGSAAGFFMLAAYDHLLRTNAQLPVTERIRIVNFSVGVPDCDNDRALDHPLAVAMWEAYVRGVLTVMAYGNDGPSDRSCSRYSLQPWVLAVGGTSRSGALEPWSSRGTSPAAGGRHDRAAALAAAACVGTSCDRRAALLHRPGVVAPGGELLTTGRGYANNFDPHVWRLQAGAPDPDAYQRFSGTSAASPVVAGIAALVIEAGESKRDRMLTPLDVITILEATADASATDEVREVGGAPVVHRRAPHEQGAGMVDAAAAVRAALRPHLPKPEDEPLAKVKGAAWTSAAGSVRAMSAFRDALGHDGSRWFDIEVPAKTEELCVELAFHGANRDLPLLGDALIASAYRPGDGAEDFVVRTDGGPRFLASSPQEDCDATPRPPGADPMSTDHLTDGTIRIRRPEPGTWRIRVEATKTVGPLASFSIRWRLTGKGDPGGDEPRTCDTTGLEYRSPGSFEGRPLVFGDVVVDDPLFRRQWGLDLIDAPEAWRQGATGRGVTVAIIDTGVDPDHPELQDALVAPNIDVYARETGLRAPACGDTGNHGTQLAGLIAARPGNGEGIVGVAPEARLLAYNVEKGGSLVLDRASLATAIREAVHAGADVINLSVGTPWADVYERHVGTHTEVDDSLVGGAVWLWAPSELAALESAISEAVAAGVVVVAGAGNNDANLPNPACWYPARLPGVVCVAAADQRGLPATASAFPSTLGLRDSDDGDVFLRAPGYSNPTAWVGIAADQTDNCGDIDDRLFDEGVWTTVPLYRKTPIVAVQVDCAEEGYRRSVGTSMAAPHVTGVAALLVGMGLNREQVHDCLRSTATGRLTSATYDEVMGHGLVNAGAAVTAAKAGDCGRLP